MGSLTGYQKSVLIGLLLGDGSLRKKRNTLLEINHSSKQSSYVMWLYEIFKDFVNTPPKIRKSGKNREAMRFTTLSFQCFNHFFDRFYSHSCKVIPNDLVLDDVSLAVWIMDDGSKDRDSIYLNTQQFNLEHQDTLIKALSVLDIEAKLVRDKKYFRLRILKNSLNKVKALVQKHIIPTMCYKIP